MSAPTAHADSKTAPAAVAKDLSKLPQPMLDIQGLYSQSGSLRSVVPDKMKAGQNGYLIATTEDFRKNSKVLNAFVEHKEARGFKVYVATEKDFGVSEQGKGRHQADKVRAWMQDNYQDMNLLYALIIANPHPDEGMIPLVKFKPRRYKVPAPDEKKDYAKYLKYKDNPRTPDGKFLLFDGSDPSDYYYADLDSDWDANGNSILAEKADYASGRINCVADVYVGRIPLYGGDHPYSQVADADALLQRTMDYENEEGDLAWRNNMFYVGGANRRFNKIRDHFFNYHGGELTTYRVSSGYGCEPLSTKWNGKVISDALNQNKPFGFTNFQEHGSVSFMAGQISTARAVELETDYPTYVYMGGCDVASPEHGNNVAYALFRHIGIATMAATRSVTSLGGDDDTDSAAAYERLYFGQSTGEAHWRLLSDYADGMGKVGASNFLMNLMGDPSVVIFPRPVISPAIVSPNMATLTYRHQFQSRNEIGQVFHIHNTTDKTQTYRVTVSPELSVRERRFTLEPNALKQLPVTFKSPERLPIGLHDGSVTITTGATEVARNLRLDVYAKQVALNLGFDTPSDRRIVGYDVSGEKSEMVARMLKETASDTFATLPKGVRANLKATKVVPGESDVTIATKIRFDQKPNRGQLQFLKLGTTFECFDLSIEEGKLRVVFRTVQGTQGIASEGRVEVDAPSPGRWHTVVASVNRRSQKVVLLLNGKRYEGAFEANIGEGIVFDRVRLGHGKNPQAVYIDELAIFDYALSAEEMAALSRDEVVKQAFPYDGGKANPAGVSLAWTAGKSLSDAIFVVAVSKTPSFSRQTTHQTQDASLIVRDLADNTTYYWRVGVLRNGRPHFPWQALRSFTTDSGLVSHPITINKRKKLRDAVAKDSEYTASLGNIARCVHEGKRLPLYFTKISGDHWLRCHSDGRLTTNYGAPKAGEYKFVFSVATEHGVPQMFERTIVVK